MAAQAFDILIVGGGQAGRRAAEGARSVSPSATIAIVGEETYAPYDRPSLSKQFLLGTGTPALCFKRDAAAYATDNIALILGARVTALDLNAKQVETANGARIGFGKLVLATGSRARSLTVPEGVADRVLTLRTIDDATRLKTFLRPGAHVIVVGAGFIGLEAASAAHERGARVTVLEASDRALARVFPREASDRVEAMHKGAGVDLHFGVTVEAIAPHGNGVLVRTSSGEVTGDVVVVGIGVAPNTELAQTAGLHVEDGIVVSAEGATSHPDVFAAGEVARHPVAGGAHRRLESWQVAELQAHAAGRTAAGAPTRHDAVPYFWSDQLGTNIQMFGLDAPGDQIVARALESSAILFSVGPEGRVTSAVGFNAGADMSVAKRLIGAPASPSLSDPKSPLRSLLRSSATA